MKKLLAPAIFFIASITANNLFAQNGTGTSDRAAQARSQQTTPVKPEPVPTSMDEYNYAMKGVKSQIENGLDLTKTGYEWRKIDNINNYSFLMLVRTDDSSVAGVLIMYKSEKTGAIWNFFMPNSECMYDNDCPAKKAFQESLNKSLVSSNVEWWKDIVFVLPVVFDKMLTQ